MQSLSIEFHYVRIIGIVVVPSIADIDIASAIGYAFEVSTHHRRLLDYFQRKRVHHRHFTRIGRDIDTFSIGAEFARSCDGDRRECFQRFGINDFHPVLLLRGDIYLRATLDGIVGRATQRAAIGSLEHIAVHGACDKIEIVERTIHLTEVASLIKDEKSVADGYFFIINHGVVVIASSENTSACKETGKKFHVLFHCCFVIC